MTTSVVQLEARAPASTQSFDAWVDRYLAACASVGRTPQTVAAKAQDLAAFAAIAVKDGEISKWSPTDTHAYVEVSRRRGQKLSTVRRCVATLRHFARWCQDQPDGVSFAQGSPLRGVEFPGSAPPLPRSKATPSQARQLFRASDRLLLHADASGAPRRKNARPGRDSALLHLLYYAGVGAQHLVGLRRDQYDGEGLVEFGPRRQSLSLHANCRDALDRYLSREWEQDEIKYRRDQASSAPSAASMESAAVDLCAPLFLSARGHRLERRHLNKIFRKYSVEAHTRSAKPVSLRPSQFKGAWRPAGTVTRKTQKPSESTVSGDLMAGPLEALPNDAASVVPLKLQSITIKTALDFIRHTHRHHSPPAGGLFAVGVARGASLVGVAVVGRPVARLLQDGNTGEVTRLCTNATANACSMLYSACWRAAKALGYRRLVTYILASEPGTSLRAAGWVRSASIKGRSWDSPSRPRRDRHPTVEKQRWEIAVT